MKEGERRWNGKCLKLREKGMMERERGGEKRKPGQAAMVSTGRNPAQASGIQLKTELRIKGKKGAAQAPPANVTTTPAADI